MNGSRVFAALLLARALGGWDREPERVPEPEFHGFERRPRADVRRLDADTARGDAAAERSDEAA
jgi:hypothetical protein